MNKRTFSAPSPPVAAAIAAACIMIFVLFVHPSIGMADNGDFFRVTQGNGIYKLDKYQEDQYFDYSSSKFGIYQYFNENTDSLLSSQTPFIKGALLLDRLFTGNDEIFDIRFLALPLCIWALIAIYLLVDYSSWGIERRYGYVIAALAVLLFADTGYLAYFNSFYAEGIVFVSFLTAMACMLLLGQHRYRSWVLISAYMMNSLVLVCAKQQNAPLGILLGLLCLPVMLRKKNPDERPSKKQRTIRRISVIACSSLLCASGAAVYLLIPQNFVEINQYHAMTRGVLPSSKNPEEALAQFHIDPQYALLDGSIYFERYPAADVEGEDLKTRFYPNYGFVSVAVYYMEHPDSLLQMLDHAAQNAYSIRPAAMGNYERSAGKASGAQTSFFTLHSMMKERLVPRTVGFMILWLGAVLAISFRDRKRTWVIACAVLMGLSQIGVSIVGAGDADLSKHIFLYNAAFDFTNFILISTVWIQWRARRYSSRKQAAEQLLKKEAVLCK